MSVMGILLVFFVLLVANLLLLSLVWILFLNIGVFETPDEDHWTNKLIVLKRQVRPQLSWMVSLDLGGGAMSASPVYAWFERVEERPMQSRVSFTFSSLGTPKPNGVFSGYSPYSEPQIICDARCS
jgi:hypothetical protein